MCEDHGHAHVPAVDVRPAELGWSGEVVRLEPVDSVSLLTVCDNTVDMLLLDEGPARRLGLGRVLGESAVPTLAAPMLQSGKAIDAPRAEHGFSVLVEVRKAGSVRRLLFDTGVTPAGCVENLRRLGRDLGEIEAIVCSHGHFDHTTGLSGLVDRLGRTSLPVVIHPEFWAQRRIAIPGADPFELPPPAATRSRVRASPSSRTASRPSCSTAPCSSRARSTGPRPSRRVSPSTRRCGTGPGRPTR
jgi:7,8-dihydropterin-6-yl-methyl-4-(beta-D-ribofuranosyl)aminobenzene 5'-phosphate synthase